MAESQAAVLSLLHSQAAEALRLQNATRAEALYRTALHLSPEDPLLWGNLTHILWIGCRPEEALQVFEQARSRFPTHLLPWRNLGNIQRDLNAFEEADAAYRQAMALEQGEEQAETAWARSQVLFGLERWHEAFAQAEARFALQRHTTWRPGPHGRSWPGTAAPAGSDHSATLAAPHSAGDVARLCVWSEQGHGDTLQYLRWVPQLIARGWTVRLELEPPLVPLARQGLAWLGDALTVAPKGCFPRPLPAGQHSSLLSLPHRLAATSLPDWGAGPYLRSPLWAPPFPRRGHRPPRIGLVWASGRKAGDAFVQREYHRRSLPAGPLHRLLRGLQRAGADLVTLQFGPDGDRAEGWGGRFRACLPASADFAENARWILAMDLVITVDTAAAHLVGALGAPGWLLLPWSADPRWLRHRRDSPWYPSLTLLRQDAPENWDGLVEQVLERFQHWKERSSPVPPCAAEKAEGSRP